MTARTSTMPATTLIRTSRRHGGSGRGCTWTTMMVMMVVVMVTVLVVTGETRFLSRGNCRRGSSGGERGRRLRLWLRIHVLPRFFLRCRIRLSRHTSQLCRLYRGGWRRRGRRDKGVRGGGGRPGRTWGCVGRGRKGRRGKGRGGAMGGIRGDQAPIWGSSGGGRCGPHQRSSRSRWLYGTSSGTRVSGDGSTSLWRMRWRSCAGSSGMEGTLRCPPFHPFRGGRRSIWFSIQRGSTVGGVEGRNHRLVAFFLFFSFTSDHFLLLHLFFFLFLVFFDGNSTSLRGLFYSACLWWFWLFHSFW